MSEVYTAERIRELTRQQMSDAYWLRVYAGQAMQGICASSPTNDWTNEMIAKDSVDLATTLLKAVKESEASNENRT